MEINLSFDGNSDNNIPAGATVSTYQHSDGTEHFYMYVNNSIITWPQAYNLAKSYKYNGLKGYLVTVTELGEDLILDNISLNAAWAGGARLDNNITTYDLDSSSSYGTANYSKWVWTCGPEAGQLLNLRSNSPCKSVGTVTSSTDANVYSNWNDVQPDGTGASGEWCMQVHFGNTGERYSQGAYYGWNDLPYNHQGIIKGLFVEFSEYPGGYVGGTYTGNTKLKGSFSTKTTDWVYKSTKKSILASWNEIVPFSEDGSKGYSLTIDIDDTKKINQNPITVAGLTDWAAIGLPTGQLTYLNADTPDATPSTTVPNKAGTYIVTYSLSAGGDDYSISRTITVDEDGSIYAEPIKDDGHEHVWDIKMADKEMTISCIGTGSPKCVCCADPYKLELVIDPTKSVNGKFVSINETGSSEAKKLLPKRKLIYEGLDGTEYGPSTSAPTAAGTYKVSLECEGRTIDGKFTIAGSGSGATISEKYIYRYPGTGINRADGFIDYTSREDVLNYAYDGTTNQKVDGIYINMTKEKLVSDFAYDCYTIDGGKKWIKGKLDDAKLAKAFGKRTNIRLSNKYDEKTKKPGEGAEQYYFNTINKRPAATTLKPDYLLYMDPYGITNGQWTLLKVTTEVNLYQYYEIGIAEGKKLSSKGFGIWPAAGGVWVPELTKAGKNQKVLYFYRTRATVDTPASKTKKVKISGVLAPTKFKADYKKEILKLKKGASLFFGESIPNLYEVTYDFENNLYLGTETKVEDFDGKYLKGATDAQAKGINIADYLTADRNTIHLWINATASKPATKVQQLVLAARGVISSEKKLKCEKGSIVLEKGKDISYEFYDETAQKWISSVPSVTGDARLRVRVKCNVKGGKENGKNYATGIEGVCEITWGVVDSKSGKEGILSATLRPSD